MRPRPHRPSSGFVPTVAAWSLVALLAACDNPAKDAQQAETSDPEPKPSGAGEAESAVGAEARIVGAESKVEFVGSKVTGSHEGGFREVTGLVRLSADGKGVEYAKVEIDMDSTFSDNEKLTKHLKAPDFFDVDKFPTSTFETTEIRAGATEEKMPDATHTVTGNLTLHGVTKSIRFAAKIAVDASKQVSVKSDFAILRKDFGIVYPGMPDDLIRNEVLLRIDVTARPAS